MSTDLPEPGKLHAQCAYNADLESLGLPSYDETLVNLTLNPRVAPPPVISVWFVVWFNCVVVCEQDCRVCSCIVVRGQTMTFKVSVVFRGRVILCSFQSKRRFITTRALLCSHFRTLPIGWCRENFVMISLALQELSRWQTDKVSHKQTLLKTIPPSLRYDELMVNVWHQLAKLYCNEQIE